MMKNATRKPKTTIVSGSTRKISMVPPISGPSARAPAAAAPNRDCAHAVPMAPRPTAMAAARPSSPALAADGFSAACSGAAANAGLLGLAAAIAVGLGAIGTAWAQSRIGAAAAGAIAERPEMGGLMLVFLALPETMVILGFLVAFFVIGKI